MPSLACFADDQLARGVVVEIEAAVGEEAVIVDKLLQCWFSVPRGYFHCFGCVALRSANCCRGGPNYRAGNDLSQSHRRYGWFQCCFCGAPPPGLGEPVWKGVHRCRAGAP